MKFFDQAPRLHIESIVIQKYLIYIIIFLSITCHNISSFFCNLNDTLQFLNSFKIKCSINFTNFFKNPLKILFFFKYEFSKMHKLS